MEKPQFLLDAFFEHVIKNAVAEHLAMVEATIDRRIAEIVDKRIEEYVKDHLVTTDAMEHYVEDAMDSITVEVRRY